MKTFGFFLYATCLLQWAGTFQLHAQQNFQPCRLVLNGGDTLNGWIDDQNWRVSPKTIDFSESKGGPIQHLSPVETSAFWVDGDWYAGKIVQLDRSPNRLGALTTDAQPRLEADTMFVRAMVLGKANLWLAVDPDGREHFCLEKDSLPITALIFKQYYSKDATGQEGVKTNQRFRGQLAYYLTDCEKAVTLAKIAKYKVGSLIKVVQAYNDCHPGSARFVKRKDPIRFETVVLAGLSNFSMNLGSNYDESLQEANFSSSTKIASGIGLDIIFPRNLGKWSLYNSLLIESFNTSAQTRTYPIGISGYVERTFRFKQTNLRLSNMLRYQQRTKRIAPYFFAGITHAVPILSANIDRVDTYFGGSVVTTSGNLKRDFGRYERTVLLGTGLQYRRFLLETRLEYANGRFFTATSNGAHTTRFFLLLGFKL